MIQDIYPSKLNNAFLNASPEEDDPVLIFDADGKLFVADDPNGIRFTSLSDVGDVNAVYLFSVDDTKYFMAAGECGFDRPGFSPRSIRDLRDSFGGSGLYAAFTAYHLWKWYNDNRFCGTCAGELTPDSKERALRCSKCGRLIYPRINPAVIVGVINGDKILITRYRTGYKHNALIAGFTEIGETLEETVAREVMEEAGIKIKNIRYYKSQPWGMAQDILVGFFCEADGDTTIHMDDNELKFAQWVKREDVVLQPNNLSLTNEMMMMFKENRLEQYI